MTQPMMTLAQAATALQGQTSAPDVSFNRVNTDSRAVEPGDLFIALKGERFDAHDFVKQALADGAAAALVNQGYQGEPGQPLIRVADTHAALGQLAAFWRQQFSLPVAGITGSNGKTSVKEMVAAILNAAVGEDQVLATRGNLNNDIGMPLTLLRLRAQHRYVVLEMGMNHLGEIAYLSRLAQPNVTVINNAQAAHLEGLGDVATVARAKGEIFEGLPADGIAVINADDAHAAMWRQLAGERKRIEFGLQTGDVCCDFTLGVYGSELTLHTPIGSAPLSLQVPGLHNVRNALAATAVTLAMGIDLDEVIRGLAAFAGVKGRLQRKAGLAGATIIDDTYNANPDSVAAALNVLSAQPGKKWLVLGDMGELGDSAAAQHYDIGNLARKRGLDHVFCMGENSQQAVAAFGAGAKHYASLDVLLSDLQAQIGKGVTVLVKGSRFMRMERVVQALTAESGK